MSPIALADARTTKRGCCFCLAVTFFLLLSGFSAAQIYSPVRDFVDSRPVFRPHPLVLVAGFPPAVQGQSFAATVRVEGGLAPYRFCVAQGTLPPGLSLNPVTGTVSGVPAVSGAFAFTLIATDSRFGYGRLLLQINVSSGQIPVSIALNPESAQTVPGAKLQFTASVKNTAQTSVIWSASAGSISPSGLFTAPMSTGTAVITATAAANTRVHASASISVQSASPLVIATTSLTGAQVNSSYSSTMAAQGGTAPYTWSLSSGSLPAGLALNSSGVIAGTVGQAGAFTFTTKVTDASSRTATRQLTLNATVANSGNFDGPAELPRAYVKSALANTPAPGNTISVNAGGSFQAAINNASCGDTIQLQAGATFSGQFTLPNKNCDDNHWIIIRTSAPDSALPSEGTRITPCYAGVASLPGRPALNCASTQKVMATLMAQKSGGPIILAAGADHYRLGPGLEITRPVGTGVNYNLVGKDANTSAADHIILDRDWLHGTAQDETTRGMFLSGLSYIGIVDSYFSDFHCTAVIGACVDSQAIAGGSGSVAMGTWKIVNNFLEAATENILFGGSGGTTTPTDIEIRHNHFFKPLTWMRGQPGFVGGVNHDRTKCADFNTPGYCPFTVKNLLEFKNAQRVLVEGNVFEHTWPGFTQHGAAILLTAMSQGGTVGNPNATVADITFRYNRVSHAASGLVMGIIGVGQTTWSIPKFAGRFSIHDDIFDDLSPAYYNGDTTAVGLAFQMSQCPACAPLQNITINHVTMLLPAPRMFLIMGAGAPSPLRGVTFTNTIVSTPPGLVVAGTGAKGPCGFFGITDLARLNSCAGQYRFTANALIGANNTWPTGNMFPRSPLEVGFANYHGANGGDYHIISGALKNAATDGVALGADVDRVNQATAGAF